MGFLGIVSDYKPSLPNLAICDPCIDCQTTVHNDYLYQDLAVRRELGNHHPGLAVISDTVADCQQCCNPMVIPTSSCQLSVTMFCRSHLVAIQGPLCCTFKTHGCSIKKDNLRWLGDTSLLYTMDGCTMMYQWFMYDDSYTHTHPLSLNMYMYADMYVYTCVWCMHNYAYHRLFCIYINLNIQI